jgi:hypothetical protein
MDKIKEKNEKLRHEQLRRRQRIKDEEDKAKIEAAGGAKGNPKTVDAAKPEATKPAATKPEATKPEAAKPKAKDYAAEAPRDGIHPSRLRQVNRY